MLVTSIFFFSHNVFRSHSLPNLENDWIVWQWAYLISIQSPLIKAEDSDYGSNGTDGIHYYLVNQTHSDSFHIDDVTGQVTVSGPVDRESTPVLHLTVSI